jgi:hypothetical protein
VFGWSLLNSSYSRADMLRPMDYCILLDCKVSSFYSKSSITYQNIDDADCSYRNNH